MDSEMRHTKERLAVECRAQQQVKPLTGDGTGAAWAHLRQRLSRAEREARVARRLVMALVCVCLAGVAGVIMVVLPWSAAIASRRSAGETAVRAGGATDPRLMRAEPSPASRAPDWTQPRLVGSSDSPGPPPGKQPGSMSLPLVGAGNAPAAGLPARSGGKPGVVEPAVRIALSPRSAPASSPSSSLIPHPLPRPGVRWVGKGFRRTTRFPVCWSPRNQTRSQRPSRYRGRSQYWRVVRVSRPGRATYWFVDPHGNWWRGRCVQPRRVRQRAARQ
jgi:hypothetical protein